MSRWRELSGEILRDVAAVQYGRSDDEYGLNGSFLNLEGDLASSIDCHIIGVLSQREYRVVKVPQVHG